MTLADDLQLLPEQSLAIRDAVLEVLGPGPLDPPARGLADLVERELPGPASGAAAGPTRVFGSASARDALVSLLFVAACIDGEVREQRVARALSIARVAGVRSPWLDLLPALKARRVLYVKQALARRAPDAKRVLEGTMRGRGLRGALEVVTFVAGLYRDPALAARYRAFEGAPDCLGRRFFDHLVSRGLTFPGEKGGVPERMVHHDLMHVVAGYDTDPAGECELAGFYAGHCARFGIDDGFTFIAVALATFQLELPVSPSVVVPARGAFDPERVLAAFRRGRMLRADIMNGWDHWPLMTLPIDEVRRRLGLEPG